MLAPVAKTTKDRERQRMDVANGVVALPRNPSGPRSPQVEFWGTDHWERDPGRARPINETDKAAEVDGGGGASYRQQGRPKLFDGFARGASSAYHCHTGPDTLPGDSQQSS